MTLSSFPDSEAHLSVLRRSIALGAVALLVSCPAFGQGSQQPQPPSVRGLFANPASSQAGRGQQLDLNVSLYGAYDGNVLLDRGQQEPDPRFQQSGAYEGGELRLRYVNGGPKGSVDFGAGTTYRYYQALKELTGFDDWASVGFTLRLASRTALRATETMAYTPYYSFGVFPGLSPAVPGQSVSASPEYSLLKRPAIGYSSSASLDHRLTPRATLSADYSFTYTDFRNEQDPYRNWSVGGSFVYRLTPSVNARIGYHYRRGTYALFAGRQPVDGQDIDAGIDYSRPIARSRRTTFGFTTGSSIFHVYDPGLGDTVIPPGLRARYLVNGSAYLNRQIGRSWNARLDYRRGVQFVDGFPGPFFSDAVAGVVGGLLGVRTQIGLTAAYTNGNLGVTTADRNYVTYTGRANAQFALFRWMAIFTEYSYYHYDFDPSVVLPIGMNRGLDRQGVRIGVNLWVPVISR